MEASVGSPALERFPLLERAERLGVLKGKSALIVAPTATGKSHIGRLVVERALERRTEHTHAYLVPYRSLAAEVYDLFLDRLGNGNGVRVRIATGDQRDAVHPEDADLLVATYESFASLLRTTGLRPGVVVADEVHLVADGHRGPVVEGLLARLLESGRTEGLCALSAVVENGEDLAGWLGVELLKGRPEDRPVQLDLEHTIFTDKSTELLHALEPCLEGAQALVFCSSRLGAERVARDIENAFGDMLGKVGDARYALSAKVRESDPNLDRLPDLVLRGIAFHHAGLGRSIRKSVEDGFRKGALGVITCTPTLAAGVNLPAEIVVVRDIFRVDVLRGRTRRVLLPSGEVLNMLGRAGRPGQADRGVGVAMIPREAIENPRVTALLRDVESGKGGVVRSQLPSSFDAVMRFVLAVVAERGEATREDVVAAYKHTLAYRDHPEPVRFDRPFEVDMMEDIPSWERVVKAKGAIRVGERRLLPDGVHATVLSEKRDGRTDQWEVIISVTGIECDCPAARRWRPGEVCKHAACAIHNLLFENGVEEEERARAIYNCGEVFAATLDIGTKLENALKILTAWELLERVPTGWRTTPTGMLAASSWFDLLLVRVAAERARTPGQPSYQDVAQWAVQDYFAEEKKRERWGPAVQQWVGEVDLKKIKLPSKYRGDFEQGLDDLARVCRLYENAAEAVGNEAIRCAARDAARALRYGVAPELVPLMALRFDHLGRARCRLLFEKGVRSVAELAGANLDAVADPRRLPGALLAGWIRAAGKVQEARARSGDGTLAEGDSEFDDLVARFRLDPAALVA